MLWIRWLKYSPTAEQVHGISDWFAWLLRWAAFCSASTPPVISGTVGLVETLFGLSKLTSAVHRLGGLIGLHHWRPPRRAFSCDRFGRKPVLILAAFMFFLSALGSTIPPTFTFLIVARLIGGVGVGIASVLAPLFISEFAPPRIRGRLVALYQLSIVIGILLAYFSNWLLLASLKAAQEASSSMSSSHGLLSTRSGEACSGLK